jgi:hypothetical protein
VECTSASPAIVESIEAGFNQDSGLRLRDAYAEGDTVSGRVVRTTLGGLFELDSDVATFLGTSGTWQVLVGSNDNMSWDTVEGNPRIPDWQYTGFNARQCAGAKEATAEWDCSAPSMALIHEIESKHRMARTDGRLMEPWQSTHGIVAGFDSPLTSDATGFYSPSADELGFFDDRAAHAWACALQAADGTNPARRPADAPRWAA